MENKYFVFIFFLGLFAVILWFVFSVTGSDVPETATSTPEVVTPVEATTTESYQDFLDVSAATNTAG